MGGTSGGGGKRAAGGGPAGFPANGLSTRSGLLTNAGRTEIANAIERGVEAAGVGNVNNSAYEGGKRRSLSWSDGPVSHEIASSVVNAAGFTLSSARPGEFRSQKVYSISNRGNRVGTLTTNSRSRRTPRGRRRYIGNEVEIV